MSVVALSSGCGGDRYVTIHEDDGASSAGPTAGSGGQGGEGGGGAAVVAPAASGIRANRLLADSARGRFYASVPGDADTYANEIVAFDTSGAILWSTFAGSEPDAMALTPDGRELWVGLIGGQSLSRIMLDDEPPAATEIRLPKGRSGEAVYPGEIAALGGATRTIALSLHDGSSPGFQGLLLVDDGVPRPLPYEAAGPTELIAGPDGWFFGYVGNITSFELGAYQWSSDGVAETLYEGFVENFHADIVYDDGIVIASNGSVLDVSMPSDVRVIGRLESGGSVAAAAGQLLIARDVGFTGDPRHDVSRVDRVTLAETVVATVAFGEPRGLRQLVTTDGAHVALVADANEFRPGANVFTAVVQ